MSEQVENALDELRDLEDRIREHLGEGLFEDMPDSRLLMTEALAALKTARESESLEPAVKSMHLENGELRMDLERMAMAFVYHFKSLGAENYVEMSLFDREEPYQRYTVTVQKVGKKSPHDLRVEAEELLALAMSPSEEES